MPQMGAATACKATQTQPSLNRHKTRRLRFGKRLVSQIFSGVNGGKQADPGMAGSLLYHMAMVSKMESETRVLIEELHVDLPDVSLKLNKDLQ